MRVTFESLSGPILESLLAGASVADAAVKHGCSARTIERWIAKGRDDPEGRYGEFAAAVDACRAERELPAGTGALTAADFRRAVEKAVIAGSVPAMRLWSELFLPGEGEGSKPKSKIASLAEARRKKGSTG